MKALPWIALALASSITLAAHADVPPPDDYVEECTLDKQKREGEECILRSVHVGQPPGETLLLQEFGFCRRCNTYGATVRGEIDCRPAKDAKPLPSDWQQQAKQRDLALPSSTPNKDRPQLSDCSIKVERDSPTRDKPKGDKDDSGSDTNKRSTKSGCGCALAERKTTPGAGLGVVLLGVVAALRRAATKRVSPRA